MVLAAAKVDSYCALNIGLGRGYSVKEILRTILEADGYAGAKIVFDPSKPTMIPLRLVDTTKAATVLDFRAATDLREGVGRTLDWYRRTRRLPRPSASA
jgi:GDP-L-fucose synthase